MSERDVRSSLCTSPRYRRYRAASKLRCALGIHRWNGHHDLGDGVNVQPISGYKRPIGVRDWRTCSWCGKHHIALRRGDDRMRFFVWGGSRDRRA